MNHFVYHNSVKLIFGEDGITEVIREINKYGKKILLVSGGSSFTKFGHHQVLTSALQNAGISYVDFGGNHSPSLAKVREGVKICRAEGIDCIIGIGGGTCMDLAKTIALGAKQEHDIWEYLTGERSVEGLEYLPVGTIVTNPSSGSEMNGAAQITQDETEEQAGLSNIYPQFSWINPEYMMSLDNRLLSYGQITSFVQMSISYLSYDRCDVSEAIAAALMQTIRVNLRKSIDNPDDKESRSNLMLASALNVSGITTLSKNGDWSMYPLQGIMQQYYRIGYTQAISVLFPYWIKHIYDGHPVFKSYFQNVFSVDVEHKSDQDILDEGIKQIFEMYRSFGIATCFSELDDHPVDYEALRSIITRLGEVPSSYVHFSHGKIEALMLDAIYGKYNPEK